ncbi:ATP-binding cassette domain-containing protein [Candidatus Woesearchaeota archaeon]|nr:ATP-binding cassette domain-containing protein [Candidatus Woesearchaeota archaeon]
MEPIIKVQNLIKVYKTYKRGTGLIEVIKSLLKRRYRSKEALKGVSFEVQDGEILGLIGPNGAGKSTIIKALSGVLYPTSGEVKILGLTPWKNRVKYVKNIGVVFGQKEQLNWDLPAIDTFVLNKDLYDIPKEIFWKRLRMMLKMLQIEKEISETPVRDLSLGERMKCKLTGALLHNPKLVFLDEPTIGLDVIAKDKMRDFIKFVNAKYKTTFIITTHDMQDIEKLCKRIIIINYGEIIYDGPLSKIKEEIISSKVIEAKFEEFKKRFRFSGCKVLEKTPYSIKIEVNTKKESIKRIVEYLLANYECVDLTITNPPIEEIIQKIYEHEKIRRHS